MAIFLDERQLSLAVVMAFLVLCVEITICALEVVDTLHEMSGLFPISIFLLVWVAANVVGGMEKEKKVTGLHA
jgi:hypothetical protein